MTRGLLRRERHGLRGSARAPRVLVFWTFMPCLRHLRTAFASFCCKNTKSFEKCKKNVRFGGLGYYLYLCSVKRIGYILPIDWMKGNISGRQDIEYNGNSAYAIEVGNSVSADNYQPRVVAKMMRSGKTDLRYFQVRTKTTINMTASMQLNMALMGAAGALFASLVSAKESQIYSDCMNLLPAGKTFRAFIVPILKEGLRAKDKHITIGSGVYIVNPWISNDAPNVPIRPAIIDKFDILK